ncbi:MAG: hypothetical protein QF437_12720 [Planctomycetota bacterium]|nr:hypothetical protein [Planctomycetota bacterium]MDP7131350.1 hypothetical protein [Planctomycetota bacterium]MDP7248591.1 hypothetical protein [Planctomycetota bacterium]
MSRCRWNARGQGGFSLCRDQMDGFQIRAVSQAEAAVAAARHKKFGPFRSDYFGLRTSGSIQAEPSCCFLWIWQGNALPETSATPIFSSPSCSIVSLKAGERAPASSGCNEAYEDGHGGTLKFSPGPSAIYSNTGDDHVR